MPTRRALLATTGVAVASAGCLGGGGGNYLGLANDSDTADAGGRPDGVRLQELSVQNNHDQAHQIQLAVEDGDDVLHLGIYDLESGGSSRFVEGPWNSETGAYRIYARLDEGGIRSIDVTQGIPEPSTCVRVLVRVDGDGRLTIWNGAHCSV